MEYALIGEVVFQIPNYKRHKEENKYEYATLETIFTPNSYQFMGALNREIQISAVWHIDFCNPLQEIEKLKNQAKEGKAYKLIIGQNVIGDFFIKEMNFETQQVDINGNAILIIGEISLEEYIKKEIEKRAIKQSKKGKAVKSTSTKKGVEVVDKQKFIQQNKKDK